MFVSELCLGTMTLGGGAQAGMWSSIGAVAQEEANQLIAKALAGGVNFIDTADIYAFGQSDENLEGEAHEKHVIFEFASFDDARRFYHSPAYQAVRAMRSGAATGTFVLIEGASA